MSSDFPVLYVVCIRGRRHRHRLYYSCNPHCRLAKFRDIMIKRKYGAVIGYVKSIAYKSTHST